MKITPSGQANPEDSSTHISLQESNNLLKVFSLLNSKQIKELLRLIEYISKPIRKLAALLFQILLFKSKSKVHFVEKCALGFVPGLYCISRLKFIGLKGATPSDLILLLEQIKGHVKTVLTKVQIRNQPISGKSNSRMRVVSFIYYR